MLSVLLNQLNRDLTDQPYLLILFQTLFCTAYFGLLRVREITETAGDHAILAKDVHLDQNKRKLLFILHHSKTHNKGVHPQLVKISSTSAKKCTKNRHNEEKLRSMYCPYQLLRQYVQARGPLMALTEQFFVFSDNRPVSSQQFRARLKLTLKHAGFNHKIYDCHSFRIGCCRDLLKLGLSMETVKKLGRWKSNAVFRYFKG